MCADESAVIPKTVLVQHPNQYVEEISLDEYVKGVVPTYLGLPAPLEALKALAIAVRSEAVVARRHARDGFDLCTTDHCYIWRPTNRYPDSDRAVDETTAQVLSVGGRIVAAPSFEHCDGHTRNSAEVWAARLDQCRGVACQCGFTQLYGHGVGLCQRGAMAMARQGATAQAILQHYYTQVEVVQAVVSARADLRHSLIVGRAVDSAGRPCADLRLALTGPAGTLHKATDADGRFWFGGVSAGQWELKVKGRSVHCGDLRTDGRNTLDVLVTVPDVPRLPSSAAKGLVPQTVRMAHPQQLVGTLGYTGVPITITDSAGHAQTVLSGSAPDYDPGGFAVPLPPPGKCTLRVFDQSFDLDVGDAGLWVRFLAQDS
jgi:hypothetical protein